MTLDISDEALQAKNDKVRSAAQRSVVYYQRAAWRSAGSGQGAGWGRVCTALRRAQRNRRA